MTATVNGRPARKKLLITRELWKAISDYTYAIKPNRLLLLTSLQGKTGSCTPFLLVRNHDHTKKAIQKRPARIKATMMSADLQGNCTPASSKATIRNAVAPKSKGVPSTSKRRNCPGLPPCGRGGLFGPRCGKLLGRNIASTPAETAPAGPLNAHYQPFI